ncbi:hypothetical protein C4J81_05720 [Deltaproteobacteria bacterium Smac51]|nr:hypothetical protein C4J81_05720 [Deltaproteobacteria bacterium Smac51]
MIQTALKAARNALRRRLGTRPNGEELVHITCPGRGVEGQRNYLGMMFIGLERENNLSSDRKGFSLDANVVFMLYAFFSDYADSLSYLSNSLAAFQENLSLHPADFPELKMPAYPLYIEPYFFPLEQQLQTWNPFMDDSIPFMFYRLRSLRFKTYQTQAPEMKGFDTGFKKAGHG